jgi:hypothetical protein
LTCLTGDVNGTGKFCIEFDDEIPEVVIFCLLFIVLKPQVQIKVGIDKRCRY